MAGTKVRISGFEMQFSDNIEMNEFYQALENICRKTAITVGIYTTRIFCSVVDGLVVGLVLTFKDDKKKLATAVDSSGKLLVNKVELHENQTSTEASLFCFNPITKAGVFSHYAGAASASIYTSIFSQAHKKVKDAKISQKVDEYTGFRERGNSKRARSRAQDYYGGSFEFKYIYQEKDLDQILKNLKSLAEIEVTTSLGIPDDIIFRWVGAAAKKSTQTVTLLDQFRSIGNIKGQLANLVRSAFEDKDRNYSLKLIGTSLAGTRASYCLGDNVEEYGFFEYDDYIDELPEDVWENYLSCKAMKALLDVVKTNTETFGGSAPTGAWNKLLSVNKEISSGELGCEGESTLKSMNDFIDDDKELLQIELIW